MKKLVFSLLFCIFLIGLVSAAIEKVEWYETGADDYTSSSGNNWRAMNFTIGTVGTNADFNASIVSLYGWRDVGASGPLIVGIRNMNATSIDAVDIANGTLDFSFIGDGTGLGDANWFNITITSFAPMNASTPYAIVARSTNTINYVLDSSSPGYTGGNRHSSTNAGVKWSSVVGSVMLFQVWGGEDILENIISLKSPENNFVTNNQSVLFNATLSSDDVAGYNITSAELFVWNSNGSIFNQTTNNITGHDNNTVWTINNFTAGSYIWSVYGCFDDGGDYNCSFGSNRTFTRELAEILNQTYNQETQETRNESFSIAIELPENTEISTANLIYNGTNYSISNITSNGSVVLMMKTIDIPLNAIDWTNSSNEFYWSFVFTGEGSQIQTTEIQYQNSTFINFQQCNETWTIQALNFTFYDEVLQENIDGSRNATTFESSWNYWVGGGGVYKNYSYQNITSDANSYQFCMHPDPAGQYDYKVNGDIDFSAVGFRGNEYHLRNATITNVSSDILLYLLNDVVATKFFLTFIEGADLLRDATVTVQKYFTGLGNFVTVGILQTDNDGVATMWQDIDKNYKYSAVKDGELVGVVEKKAVCSVAPCTLNIFITTTTADVYEPYYDIFAQNVVSTLTYNKTLQVVTYDFLDLTGLANYFRLKVDELYYNQSGVTVCDKQSFSPAGTLTCNLTGYEGEFVATGYISHSPELIDKVLNIITTGDTIEDLGPSGLFITLAILITLVFAGAIIGRGSPSVVLIVFGLGILVLKLMAWFPFTWTVVVSLEFVVVYMLWRVKV